jgi:hypothetical protein
VQHDVFICHASEDKDELVRPLAAALKAEHIDVWYDEFSLKVGDSLRQSIDRGLAGARYGIVILSPAFFQKPWTQWELNGLVARMMQERRRLILPVWHRVGLSEVMEASPSLADIRALHSKDGVTSLCAELLAVVRPAESPLIVAKEELARFGWDPPPISDEWWLNIVECQSIWDSPTERLPWFFPISTPAQGARDRGLAIAWTALQLDWQEEARRLQVCQTTHPAEVFAFIDANPALGEICAAHPDIVANYAPQLLFPEFSGRFSRAFDELVAASARRVQDWPDNRFPGATCERYYALRLEDFGGYQAKEVADKWVRGQGGDHSAQHHHTTDYIFWLLSQSSCWMPLRGKEVLLQGIRNHSAWSSELSYEDVWTPHLAKAIYAPRRRPMRWTRALRAALEIDVTRSLSRLGIQEHPEPIAAAFIDRDFTGGFDEVTARWRR